MEKNKRIEIYKKLILPRLIEEKMLILLRQGKISKWFSGFGQEAISVGTTYAMDEDEFILPVFRCPIYNTVNKIDGINSFTYEDDLKQQVHQFFECRVFHSNIWTCISARFTRPVSS